MSLRTVTLTCAATLIACGGEAVAPEVAAAPLPPTVVALEISPGHATITLGQTQMFVALKRMSDGTALLASATWVSTNPDVATINANGSAVAVGIGQANIFASVDGLTAMGSILVKRPANPGTSNALIVEAFSMIEYPSGPGSWAYAPQLRVRAAAGRTVTMLLIDFLIPGTGWVPPWRCAATIPATESSELNGEFYGDWSFSIGSTGQASGNVRVDLTFLEESGKVATTTAYGAVVAGDLPSTIGGDPGACYRAYRPPG